MPEGKGRRLRRKSEPQKPTEPDPPPKDTEPTYEPPAEDPGPPTQEWTWTAERTYTESLTDPLTRPADRFVHRPLRNSARPGHSARPGPRLVF